MLSGLGGHTKQGPWGLGNDGAFAAIPSHWPQKLLLMAVSSCPNAACWPRFSSLRESTQWWSHLQGATFHLPGSWGLSSLCWIWKKSSTLLGNKRSLCLQWRLLWGRRRTGRALVDLHFHLPVVTSVTFWLVDLSILTNNQSSKQLTINRFTVSLHFGYCVFQL